MLDLLTHAAAVNLYKMRHQGGNVFAARPQRRQQDRKHIQTVVEVAAKFATSHHVFQVSVGRRHQPHVHLVGPGAAQALELLFLQHAQQFGLECQRDIAHLVQKQRAFVGHFETTDFLRDGARESAPSRGQIAHFPIESQGIAAQFSFMKGRPHRELTL